MSTLIDQWTLAHAPRFLDHRAMYEHESFESAAHQRVSEVYEEVRAEEADPDSTEARAHGYLAALQEARAAGDGAQVAAAWYYLANLWSQGYEREKACTAYLRLIAAENEHFGPLDAELQGSWHNFGGFLMNANEPSLVECAMRVSLRVGRLHLADTITDDHDGVQQLLMMMWNTNLYERMFHWAPQLAGATDADALGQAHRCLGHAYAFVGRFSESRAAYEASVRYLDPSDEHYLDAFVGLAESFVECAAATVNPPEAILDQIRTVLDRGGNVPEVYRAANFLATCGSRGDLPRIFDASVRYPHTSLRKTYSALLVRGIAVDELHRELKSAVARASTADAHEVLARFELDHELGAREALREACAGGRESLLGMLALTYLDDGDAAALDALVEQGSYRAAMLRVVIAVLALERDPTEASARGVLRAFEDWTRPWATPLDDDGNVIA